MWLTIVSNIIKCNNSVPNFIKIYQMAAVMFIAFPTRLPTKNLKI